MLSHLFSMRFLKFCAVGASGVVVNLLCLFLFADLFGWHTNLASALSIEVSIVTNFLLNEVWTFSDRKAGANRGVLRRAVRFHLVSLLGACIQWALFVAGNVFWLFTVEGGGVAGRYFEGAGWLAKYLVKPIVEPPEVGGFKYLSQMVGIAAATFWNFLANLYWTWREEGGERADGEGEAGRAQG